DVRVGDEVSATGSLGVAGGPDLAAVLFADPDPVVIHPAWWPWRVAETVRSAVVDAVSEVGMPQRSLIPAMVDGDDTAIPDDMTAAFTDTGLTHLLAVSGSNLTLVLGFV